MTDRREEYVREMRARMDEWERKAAELRRSAEYEALKGRLRLEEEMTRMRHQRERLAERMEAVTAAGAEGWERVRGELEDVWGELQASWKRVVSTVRSESTAKNG